MYLSLFQLCFILPLFLAHYHVALGQVSLDAKTVLLISISRLVNDSVSTSQLYQEHTNLVDRLSLLYLELQKLLDTALHDLPPLLHPTSMSGQRLLQLTLHLGGDILMRLAHRLYFPSYRIQRCSKGASFRRAQRFPTETEKLASIFVFNGRPS